MLRILSSPKTLCDGMSRRDLLWAGGLGALGLTLEQFLRGQAHGAESARHFGRAKSCILLYLYGAASQLETWDPKPDAPAEVRGTLGSIRTSMPGVEVGELMPHFARVIERTTVIRSMTHPYPIHGVAYATSGIPQIDVAMELSPHDGRHWPFIGSVVDYLGRQRRRAKGAVPDNMALPFPFSTQRTGEVRRAGPYAAFLGSAYHPTWADFRGQATRSVLKSLGPQQKVEFRDPYMGVTPDSFFELADAARLPADITLDRLQGRRRLVEQFDQVRADLAQGRAGQSADRFRDMAYSLISSEKVRAALDLRLEPTRVRESYGASLFGQSALAARRLVEAGSRFVTVFWDEYGLAGSGFDTHWDHYPRMKDELMPGLDRGLAGLILDLDERGMLDETLVVCLTEHGRTPKLNAAAGGGRDHWSQAYSVVLAGGGVARGKVIGKSDGHAATVKDNPISPKDILATTYHLLGFDPHGLDLRDRANRPLAVEPTGKVIAEALS